MESTHTSGGVERSRSACAKALPLCAERRMLQRWMGLAQCLGSSAGLDVGSRLKIGVRDSTKYPNVGSVIWR